MNPGQVFNFLPKSILGEKFLAILICWNISDALDVHNKRYGLGKFESLIGVIDLLDG